MAIVVLVFLWAWPVLVATSVQAAGASCARRDIEVDLLRTELVVVGTVTATRSGGRVATVVVDDIWRGDAAKVIEVHGGPDDNSLVGPYDHAYRAEGRYLFFLRRQPTGSEAVQSPLRYDDEPCSNTQAWTDAVAYFRPPTAHGVGAPPGTIPPDTEPSAESAVGALFLVGAACFVMFGFVALPVRGGPQSEYAEVMGRFALVVCRIGVVVMVLSALAWLCLWLT